MYDFVHRITMPLFVHYRATARNSPPQTEAWAIGEPLQEPEKSRRWIRKLGSDIRSLRDEGIKLPGLLEFAAAPILDLCCKIAGLRWISDFELQTGAAMVEVD